MHRRLRNDGRRQGERKQHQKDIQWASRNWNLGSDCWRKLGSSTELPHSVGVSKCSHCHTTETLGSGSWRTLGSSTERSLTSDDFPEHDHVVDLPPPVLALPTVGADVAAELNPLDTAVPVVRRPGVFVVKRKAGHHLRHTVRPC